MTISPKTTKRLASGLKRSLHHFGIEATHGKSLDILSHLMGDRNWNTYVAKAEEPGTPSSDFFSARNILESLQDALIILGQTHERSNCNNEDCPICDSMDKIGEVISSYDKVYGALEMPERDFWFVHHDTPNGRKTCAYIGKATTRRAAIEQAGNCGFTGEEDGWHVVDIDPIASGIVEETFEVTAYENAAMKEINAGKKKVLGVGLLYNEARELAFDHDSDYGLFILESEQRNKREEINNCLNLTYYLTEEAYANKHHHNIEDGYFFRNDQIRTHVRRELEMYEVIVLSDLKDNEVEVFIRSDFNG